MNMENQDRDWLDERLTMSNYIPDDGFTARVVSRLPESRPQKARSFRSFILLLSGLVAAVLALVQIVPVFRNLNHVALRYLTGDSLGHVASFVQQPVYLYSAAGCMGLLAIVSIPFLRRWV
jgi:hypothetical protein